MDTLHSQGALASLDPYNLIDIHERLLIQIVMIWSIGLPFSTILFTGSVSALGTATHEGLVQDARELKETRLLCINRKECRGIVGFIM